MTTARRSTRRPNAVFISYRRADSGRWAARLAQHVGFRFGHDLVFRDVEDIRWGENFREVLARELDRCRVFLVLIGPHWVVTAEGERRLARPRDILRAEVAHALGADGTVIPVLVDGARLPAAAELPPPLRPLVDRQAVPLRPQRWNADVRALLDRLQVLILPSAPTLPLERAQRELVDLQQTYFDRLDRDPARALDLARDAQAFLDRALPLYPQDPWLKVTRGYLGKNEAMALVRLHRDEEAMAALDAADGSFRTMRAENARDEAAWNGLGSVALVRADLLRRQGRLVEARRAARASLGFIDKALALNPNYAEARGDRTQAEALRRALG
jgi:hypothetical protein